MTVDEAADGLRSLFLDEHVQSEIRVIAREEDGKETFSKAEPLELVQVMSIMSLAWVDGFGAKTEPAVVSPPSEEAEVVPVPPSSSSSAPPSSVLLIGVGGGSIANVLLSALPADSTLHLVELEPEVLQAAVDFFGVQMVAPRCTGEAADGAAIMRDHAAKCRSARAMGGSVPGYDVLILDAFTKDGLAASTQQKATLDDAAARLSDRGLLIVNLHTGDESDPDYVVARGVLRSLAVRFDAVYSVLCSTTLNLIAVCHQGPFLDADDWEGRLKAQMLRAELRGRLPHLDISRTMSRFDFVGGKAHKVSKNVGLWR